LLKLADRQADMRLLSELSTAHPGPVHTISPLSQLRTTFCIRTSALFGISALGLRVSGCALSILTFVSVAGLAQVGAADEVFDVRKYGALGDGTTLDSPAINQTIEACVRSGGGIVQFPPGRYLCGTLDLRSHVHLVLSAGASVVGTTNLANYHHASTPTSMPEAKWGKWHRALLVGDSVEDVSISGEGVIDGRKAFDPTGEEHMRGPHAVAFLNCRRFSLRDVNIVDAANYAVYFEASDEVEVRNVKIVGGWDGVHWRGGPERWCTNVTVVGCQFYTGDDAIAGRYWDHAVISGCIINSSCNGIRLIGPAKHLIVDNCLFYGPGLQPHRTSGEMRRTNMLSGIILQPGAWDATRGPLDDVLISRVTMKEVASPLTLWSKPGNTVGRVTLTDLHATGVYRSALSVESWSDAPITNVVIRGAQIEFTGGGQAEQATQPVKGPGVDARPLPAWGIYLRNADRITLEDVRLSLDKDDLRPVIFADAVKQLKVDGLRFPRVEGVGTPLLSTNGTAVEW
jgi:hypothetical protein